MIMWQATIVNGDRDSEGLVNGMKAGDWLCTQFLGAIGKWLSMMGEAKKPPLCLTCKHEFRAGEEPPAGFMITYSENPRVKQMILTGICDRCIERPQAELLKIGAAGVAKVIDGEVCGFFVGGGDPPREH